MSPPMNPTNGIEAPKVCPRHLRRNALVYVRQSTLRQVEENAESTRLQYSLKDRAVGLGWSTSMVEVIDSDLGQSGRSIDGRSGFVRLVGEVSLGHVGLVLSREVSRLSRSLADWGQLLEVCCRTDTLIADAETVYDLNRHADRFLLGVLGTVSESELHTMRMRMHEGREAKASRGELSVPLPRGYVLSPDGRVELDPDEEVRAVVRLVFDLFAACGTLSGLLRILAERSVQLPRRSARRDTRGALEWARPNLAGLHRMLLNPVYAGAFAWGRNGPDGSGRRSWRHLIRDHHPAYISWETLEFNRKKLSGNRHKPRSGSRGNVMSGLVWCGHCHRQMQVRYSSHVNYQFDGEVVRSWPMFVCPGEARDYGGDRCQFFSAGWVEPLLSRWVGQALSSATVELSRSVASDAERDRREQHETWHRRLERADQEVNRALRQYDAVEPENRLVARSLESRYEETLEEQRRLGESYQRFCAEVPKQLSGSDWERIRQATQDISRLWNEGGLEDSDRASILSLLIERIVATQRDGSEQLTLEIHWHGGHVSTEQIRIPVRRLEQLSSYEKLCSRVRELGGEGKSRQEIADLLNAEGFRPPRRENFSASSVANLLSKLGMCAEGPRNPRPSPVDRQEHEWTLAELAERLGDMPLPTLYGWVRTGVVRARREDGEVAGGEMNRRWLILADETELERLKERRRTTGNHVQVREKAWNQVVSP